MRVALVGPFPFDRDRVQGGVETALMSLASALARTDVETHAISFVAGLDRPVRREHGGVVVHYLPRIRRLGSLTLHVLERRSLARLLLDLRPDVVHAQDAARYGFVSLKAARGVPVIVTIHGIAREELSFETSLLARLRVVIADLVPQRHVIRNARYFTESTRYPEDYFRGRIRGRVWDISNPIPDEFFAVDPVREPGRVLYTGSIIPRKRLLDLIAAMRTVCASRPDARLYVAGGEPHAAYAAKVKALVAELGLGGRVAFLGARPPRAMAEEYRRASVFVLPSGQETSPLAIGEAMASGVAVVATRVGGVPYLVHEGETGHTVAPGDVPALSDRIARVLDDPSYAAALGRAGRERAEERFRIDVVARQVRAMYDEAVGGG